jgi:protein required for attachment to host cells
MKLKSGTMVMVADGSRFLLLRNDGDALQPELKVVEHRSFKNPANRELLSDAPGVGHSAASPGRDTFEKTDPHQDNEDRFAADAARVLASAANSMEGELIVVAPPDTLSVMRHHYDRTVKARLLAEISKDFTKHPVGEIMRLILEHGD